MNARDGQQALDFNAPAHHKGGISNLAPRLQQQK